MLGDHRDGQRFNDRETDLNASPSSSRSIWLIEFSFAHRGRNGEDTLKLTITDLGADNEVSGGDDTELFAKEFTTGNTHWQVYDSAAEPEITSLGNKVRFAFTAVNATGGRGPDNTEGNFLDAANFGTGAVTAKHSAGDVP